MTAEGLKGLIEYIVTSLVDDPSQVQVREISSGNNIRLELRVAKEDMGRVIGKHGKVANSIRMLLTVAAARMGKQASLDVIDPD